MLGLAGSNPRPCIAVSCLEENTEDRYRCAEDVLAAFRTMVAGAHRRQGISAVRLLARNERAYARRVRNARLGLALALAVLAVPALLTLGGVGGGAAVAAESRARGYWIHQHHAWQRGIGALSRLDRAEIAEAMGQPERASRVLRSPPSQHDLPDPPLQPRIARAEPALSRLHAPRR